MTTNLTKNEQEVLKAIVENAHNVGDNDIEFLMSDVAKMTGKSQRSIQGVCSSLKKKGFLRCYNCGGYFDGEIYPVAEEWYQETFETKKEEIVDDFDKPVVDERVVRLNEILNTKISSVSGKKRDSLKIAKTAAKYILENWDNAELNGGLKIYINDDEMKARNEELHQIAKSRYWQLVELAVKEIEEKIFRNEISLTDSERCLLEIFVFDFGKTLSQIKEEAMRVGAVQESEYDIIFGNLERYGFVNNNGVTHAGRKAYDCLLKKNDEPKVDTTPKSTASKKSGKTIGTTKKTSGTARKVGDHHPTKPWIWTEYKPGKFDWRTDKTMTGEKKVVAKKNKTDKKATKVEEHKQITTEEFISITQNNKRNLSTTQAEYLKLLKKGYWIWNNDGHYFFKNEEGKMKQCNMDSLKSLFKKFNIEEIPSCLMR